MSDMTRDEILRLAREADSGFEGGPDADGTLADSLIGLDAIERFAALVAAAEREACAKICDTRALQFHSPSPFRAELREVADAIRKRGET